MEGVRGRWEEKGEGWVGQGRGRVGGRSGPVPSNMYGPLKVLSILWILTYMIRLLLLLLFVFIIIFAVVVVAVVVVSLTQMHQVPCPRPPFHHPGYMTSHH